MKCYKCRAEVKDDVQFCPSCGAVQQVTESLIRKAAKKDAGALEQLFYMTRESVYFTIQTMVWDENAAAQLVQESYVKAFKSLSQLKNPSGFARWMKHTVCEHVVEYLRKKRPEIWEAEDGKKCPAFADDRVFSLPETDLTLEQAEERLAEILNALPAAQRLLAGLFYGQELSLNEIGELLGFSENGVKNLLLCARETIGAEVIRAVSHGAQTMELAPTAYLMWLYRGLKAGCAERASDVVLHEILKKTAGGKGAKAAKAVGAAAMAVAGESVGEVAKEGLKATITKIIAGLTATAVIGGGTGAVVHTYNENKAETLQSAAQQEMQVETLQEESAEEMADDGTAAGAENGTGAAASGAGTEGSSSVSSTAADGAGDADSTAEAGTTVSGAESAEPHFIADFSEIDAQTLEEIQLLLTEEYQKKLKASSSINITDGGDELGYPKNYISAITDVQIGTEGYFAREIGSVGDEGNLLFVPCYITLEDVQVWNADGSMDYVTYEDAVGMLGIANLFVEDDGEIVFEDHVDFYGFYVEQEQLVEEWLEPLENRYRFETVNLD